ncbi:MAG: hypothetical protein COW00_03060 [Bdellovibrio sp. CG12_big_fil_rev_8_21_14_0_65_39_13]|nr:MAG: hypothetical protein COW78_19190 [Bdellovibrio sp. CG22_combo_CG10-13_8_21_14_all_39_27]PIQ61671.1 MAG: hypothetical protein COW00_03060 [Bdellovibrio sp. CG12_big_fil_rev_8_21_14_0_65_39_13]PIR35615.1 MAG: hypothetical protein COV37_07450 [Bdellovibrio sp. CG11_big_fil_rev_8_21_14_0_20_39_38]PJB52530.1 MAG: hypothetical protein CO099_12115 [Bdellovibrio sp. CG_4_9_14_3_um_filter_39_7]
MKNLVFVILAILAINVTFAAEVGEMDADAKKCVRSAQDGRKADVAIVGSDVKSESGATSTSK